jgi:8-oxo-dGTP diphosphatase
MSAELAGPIAGVVLKDRNGRYLLVQEKRSDIYGLWNLPAGKVDEGETLKQAAIREAREETGLEVELTSDGPLLTKLSARENRQLNSFRAKVISGELKHPEEELLDAVWFTLDEIKQINTQGKLRDPWVIKSILKSNE